MGFAVPVSGDLPSDSVFVSSPMRAHVAIVDCDEDGSRLGGSANKGEMVVEFEVLAASVPNQEGMRHRTYFAKTVAAAKRILTIALAAGLTTQEELEKHKAAGTMPEFEFERDLKGKQLFIDLVESTYEGKTKIKLEWGMFHLASKPTSDKSRWPRNETMIAKSGAKMPEAKPNPSQGGKPKDPPKDDPLADVVL